MHSHHLASAAMQYSQCTESAMHLSATEQFSLTDGARKKLQSHHLLNIVTTGICATSKAHGAVTVEELLEERTA